MEEMRLAVREADSAAENLHREKLKNFLNEPSFFEAGVRIIIAEGKRYIRGNGSRTFPDSFENYRKTGGHNHEKKNGSSDVRTGINLYNSRSFRYGGRYSDEYERTASDGFGTE